VATNLPLKEDDFPAIATAAKQHRIDLVVVGPETPLAAGIVDELSARDIRVFGPTKAAARIEASKAFAKELMARGAVQTPRSRTFTDEAEALRYVATHREPLVVKASGLAGGKGAIVCQNRREAETAVREMFAGKFGAAGREVLVEEFIEGEEISLLFLTDGVEACAFPPAQDHKRLGEGDTGPNTGGMGAYTPVSFVDEFMIERAATAIVRPVLSALAESTAPYRGVLYVGLMVTPDLELYVLEFNCRFGDPEAQVVLPAISADLAEQMWRIAAGEKWRPVAPTFKAARAAVATVLAARGYPEAPQKGAVIELPDRLPDNTLIFHAGTSRDPDGSLRVAGGRVLNAVGMGADVLKAAEASRDLADRIRFEGKTYRRDIAWRELRRAGAPRS
jgi:phosphoribosylamine--glycine ligase